AAWCDSGLMHRSTYPYPITSPRRNPALPRAPHRGHETRLAGRHLVRPNDDLFGVLPLDRHRFVSGLVAALIDGEIAKDSLRLKGHQRFPDIFSIAPPSPPYGIYQKLAPGICPCRLNRRGVAELLRVRRDELLISRIRKGGVTERAAVDKLGV